MAFFSSLLEAEGDGLSLAELCEECANVDLDQIAARQETLQVELKDHRERIKTAIEVCAEARQAFQAIGGDDRAARAEAAKQEALADMGEIASRYIRVRASATILHWAIERYRREKTAPLLKRAGQFFSTLTFESFGSLKLEYDDQDKASLCGIRPNGQAIGVSGMSDGTVDQLYLALRLAAVEEYLSRAAALPFIADDLFINFSDERAAAGFQVLGEFGRKTQVLFFTHHQHLVDIAKEVLGDDVNIVTLGSGANKENADLYAIG